MIDRDSSGEEIARRGETALERVLNTPQPPLKAKKKTSRAARTRAKAKEQTDRRRAGR